MEILIDSNLGTMCVTITEIDQNDLQSHQVPRIKQISWRGFVKAFAQEDSNFEHDQIQATDGALPGLTSGPLSLPVGNSAGIVQIVRQLKNYFADGKPLGPLDWECLDTSDLSDFQVNVLKVICKIPHGETRPYAWVAKRLGQSKAARAVGQALRRNPFMVLVPCHRVIATDGKLRGFMGKDDLSQPELRLKSELLTLEDQYTNPVFSFLQNPSYGSYSAASPFITA